jgi:hypothetical protein
MTTPTTTTTISKGKDYGERTVSELVSMVNAEYAAIMEAERTHLQRAIGVGEKLLDLKPRVAKHGEWQQWLKTNCPKISIETANLYMRLAKPENLDKLEKAAAAKSVTLTDLTITEAREILAKKPDTSNNSDTQSEEEEEKVEEVQSDETEQEVIGKEWLETLEPDDLIFWVKEVHSVEYLKELAKKLAAELAKTLPLPPAAPASVVAPASTPVVRRST